MLETYTPQQVSAFSFVLLLVALCPGFFTPWGNADKKDLLKLMQRYCFCKVGKGPLEGGGNEGQLPFIVGGMFFHHSYRQISF